MKTLPFIKVSHLDEGNDLRKLSQDDDKIVPLNNAAATSKQSTAKAPIISEPITPFTSNTDETCAQASDTQTPEELEPSKNVRKDKIPMTDNKIKKNLSFSFCFM
jgi:hypothetical protein